MDYEEKSQRLYELALGYFVAIFELLENYETEGKEYTMLLSKPFGLSVLKNENLKFKDLPILSLVRQALEISIKSLHYALKSKNIETTILNNIEKTHDIIELYDSFIKTASKIDGFASFLATVITPDMVHAFQEFLLGIGREDRKSDMFRYSFDKAGNKLDLKWKLSDVDKYSEDFEASKAYALKVQIHLVNQFLNEVRSFIYTEID